MLFRSLLYAREAITYSKEDSDDINIGKKIVHSALSSPFKQILTNAGYDNPEWYLYELGKDLNTWMGYNLKTETIVDMSETGILDPTKVVRLAVENAASVAGTILTTETVVHDEPSEKKKEDDGMAGMGMGF